MDQPEPEQNVAAPILPVDGNNGRQPISSPQPSDDGAAANVAVSHEQRRNLRPLALADRDEGNANVLTSLMHTNQYLMKLISMSNSVISVSQMYISHPPPPPPPKKKKKKKNIQKAVG